MTKIGKEPFSLKKFVKQNWSKLLLAVYLPISWICILSLAFILNQRRFIYQAYAPNNSRTHVLHPRDYDFQDGHVEEAWIEVPREPDIRLHSYLLLRRDVDSPQNVPTLFWCQGSGGNIGHRVKAATEIFKRCNCNIFLISYRGYGYSSGDPTFRGIQRDMLAALEHLQAHPQIDPTNLYLFGQSIGGAISLDLLTRRPHDFKGIILENTFKSLKSVMMTHGGLLRPLLFVLSEPWDNLAAIEVLQGMQMTHKKVLLISGRADDFIYPEHMDTLFERLQQVPSLTAELVHIPKGRHIAMYDEPGYYDHFTDYFNHANSNSKNDNN